MRKISKTRLSALTPTKRECKFHGDPLRDGWDPLSRNLGPKHFDICETLFCPLFVVICPWGFTCDPHPLTDFFWLQWGGPAMVGSPQHSWHIQPWLCTGLTWQVLAVVRHSGEHFASNICYLDTFQLYTKHADRLRLVTWYFCQTTAPIYWFYIYNQNQHTEKKWMTLQQCLEEQHKTRAASIRNKCAIADHVSIENHVIDCDNIKVIDRESGKTGRLIKEAVSMFSGLFSRTIG